MARISAVASVSPVSRRRGSVRGATPRATRRADQKPSSNAAFGEQRLHGGEPARPGVLDPEPERRLDPHRGRAPYVTRHSCRHSFALYMLVILHHLMDRRFGLSPEERRDYRLLHGDPGTSPAVPGTWSRSRFSTALCGLP